MSLKVGDKDIWADAVTKYEKATGHKLKHDSTFSRSHSLDEFSKEVDQLSESFSKFRNEHGRFYSALRKCVQPLEHISSLAQTALGNTVAAPAAVVFGAAKYLLGACDEVSAAYDGLEELFKEISDITERLQGAKIDRVDASLREKITDILAFILEIIGMSEAYIKRRRFKQWGRTIFLKDDSIQEHITKLEKYVQSEVGLVIHLTYGRLGNVQDGLENLQAKMTGIDIIREDLNIVLSAQSDVRRSMFSEADAKILSDSLATEAASIVKRRHDENLESLTNGTGLWIRDEPLFGAWQEEKAPLLWIFGKPGTGKTFLAAKTVDILQQIYPPHPDGTSLTSVSYFYIKDDNPNLQDLTQLFKAVALQIAEVNGRYKKFATSVVKKKDSLISAKRTWETLFLDFFTEATLSETVTSLAFIIIDGLDEAPEKERVQFISCLTSLITGTDASRRCRIQIAVFARPSIQADPGFDHVGFQSRKKVIEATSKRNEKDIATFIQYRLRNVSVLRTLDARRTPEAAREFKALVKQITNSIQNKSHGMFKWAGLAFDQIWKLQSPEAIVMALNRAPHGLEEMIHHTLKRLELEEPTRVLYMRSLLMLVFCAFEPLCIAELWILLLLTLNEHCYEVEHDIQGRYASLFELLGEADQEKTEFQEELKAEETTSLFDDLDSLSDDGAEGVMYEEDGGSEDIDHTSNGGIISEQSFYGRRNTLKPRWSKISVTFGHTSIRDYLEHEGDPTSRRWHDCSLVVENPNTAHLHFAIICVRILNGDIEESYEVPSLKRYAKLYYMKHLACVDFTKICVSDQVEGICLLVELFYDGRLLLATSFDDENDVFRMGYCMRDYFVQTWFGTSTYSAKVRQMLGHILNFLDGERKDWAKSCIQSARVLFEPMASVCKLIWLTKKGWDDEAYLDKSEREVWILYAYHSLTDDGENDNMIAKLNNETYQRYIEQDTLKALAESEDIPKSEHWYTGVAWSMMECDYVKDAIEHFGKALEINSTGYVAMEGLANCYGYLKQYHEAIDWMEKAIASVPNTEGLIGIDFYMWPSISRWHSELGNNDQAVESAQFAYSSSRKFLYGNGTASDSSLLQAVKQYILALFEVNRYDEIVELLYELDETATLCGASLLIVFLQIQYLDTFDVGIYDKVGTIMRDVEDKAFGNRMVTAMIQAAATGNADEPSIGITEGDSEHINWLIFQAAQWIYQWGQNPEDSLVILEKLIERIDDSSETIQQSQSWTRADAAGLLSPMYFQAALACPVSSPNRNAKPDPLSSSPIIKLGALAKHKQGGAQYYRASYPAILYGVWLRDHAKASEKAWRACFRPSIKRAIYLLSDEDPWNDQHAYLDLGTALLLGGDMVNAGIALGIALKPLADLRSQEVTSNVLKQVKVGTTASHDKDEERKDAESEVRDCEPVALLANVGDVSSKSVGSDIRGVAKPPTDYEKEEQEEDDELIEAQKRKEREEDNTKLMGFCPRFTCDGPCNRSWNTFKELHFCQFCYDVCFCESCINLLTRNEIPFRVCNPNHQLLRVLPLTPAATDMIESLVSRDFGMQASWLQQLSKAWE